MHTIKNIYKDMSRSVTHLPESVTSLIQEFRKEIGSWDNLYELLGKIEYLKLTKFRVYYPSTWEYPLDWESS